MEGGVSGVGFEQVEFKRTVSPPGREGRNAGGYMNLEFREKPRLETQIWDSSVY